MLEVRIKIIIMTMLLVLGNGEVELYLKIIVVDFLEIINGVWYKYISREQIVIQKLTYTDIVKFFR